MNNQSTALMAAFDRAYHAAEAARPVFDDTMARRLMSEEEYRMIGQYIVSGIDFFAPEKKHSFADDRAALRYLVQTQIAPTPVARARFCEDHLRTAVLTGARQYVILGAGVDTFAFRETAFLRDCPVFEVDHPATQADKKERIARAGLSVPENLHFVPADFAADDWRDALLAAGFDPKKKTFFSWLGVSYYLTEEAIGKTLEVVAALSADGSSLVFDYGDEYLFRSDVKRVQNMLAMAAAGGEPMRTCFSESQLIECLEAHGFLLYENMTPPQIQQAYFADQDEPFTAFEHICFAHAVCKHLRRQA